MMHIICKAKTGLSYRIGISVIMAFLVAVVLVPGILEAKTIKPTKQTTFASPEDAVKAIIGAMKTHDLKATEVILGPGSRGVVSSGDEVADREGRELFIKAYDEKNMIEMKNSVKAMLYVGKDEWPLPIPIVKKGKRWHFDTKAGKEEILNRRIGRNELSAIQACLAYVDAQKEYAEEDRDDDGLIEYAEKFVSDPGKKNGLFWEVKEGEKPSPLGPAFSGFREKGYDLDKVSGKPTPYHGYYFKILTSQGKNAPGGAYEFGVNGNMIGGFALIAYPATYGNSGVTTFIVNQDGIVYQKNLGKNTDKIAEAVKMFDPDTTWKKVE